MRYGALCNKDGTVKRTWSLVSGHCAVSIEHGDEVIEWDVAHGDDPAVSGEDRLAQVTAAMAMQETVPALTTREAALAVAHPHLAAGRGQRRTFTATIAAGADKEVLYRSDGEIVTRPRGSREFPSTPHPGHLTDVKTSQ